MMSSERAIILPCTGLFIWFLYSCLAIHLLLVCPYHLTWSTCLAGGKVKENRNPQSIYPFDVPLRGEIYYKAPEQQQNQERNDSCDLKNSTEIFIHNLYEALEWQFGVGWQSGASLSFYQNGERMFDVAGGGKRSVLDTDFNIQTIVAGLSLGHVWEMLILSVGIDKGWFSFDERISQKIWPEFRGNGKEAITIQDILSHRSGLGPTFSTPCKSIEEIPTCLIHHTPRGIRGQLAHRGYLEGYLIKEIITRSDPKKRKHFDQIVREEILQTKFNSSVADKRLGIDIFEEYFCPFTSAKKDKIPLFGFVALFSPWYDTLMIITQLYLPRWFSDSVMYLLGEHRYGLDPSRLYDDELVLLHASYERAAPFYDESYILNEKNSDNGQRLFSNLSWISLPNPALSSAFSSRALAYALDSYVNGKLVSTKTRDFLNQYQDMEHDHVLHGMKQYTIGGLVNIPYENRNVHVLIKNCIGMHGWGSSFAITCTGSRFNVTLVYLANLGSSLFSRSSDPRAANLITLVANYAKEVNLDDDLMFT